LFKKLENDEKMPKFLFIETTTANNAQISENLKREKFLDTNDHKVFVNKYKTDYIKF
jgi:hypothetical protein